MSCANMGISQLECLQLRRLVGPSGLSLVTDFTVGDPFGGTVLANIPLTLQNGTAVGSYLSNATIPSETGIMRVTFQTLVPGAQPVYYKFQTGTGPDTTTSVGVPVQVAGGDGADGFAGWWYEGLMFYTNETSSPIPITVTIGAQYTATTASVLYMHVRTISFGPYVKQD